MKCESYFFWSIFFDVLHRWAPRHPWAPRCERGVWGAKCFAPNPGWHCSGPCIAGSREPTATTTTTTTTTSIIPASSGNVGAAVTQAPPVPVKECSPQDGRPTTLWATHVSVPSTPPYHSCNVPLKGEAFVLHVCRKSWMPSEQKTSICNQLVVSCGQRFFQFWMSGVKHRNQFRCTPTPHVPLLWKRQ